MKGRFAKYMTALAVLAPLASQAGVVSGVEECTQKFIEKRVPGDAEVRFEHDPRLTEEKFRYGTVTRATLQAVGTESGTYYGSARCILDRRGELLGVYFISRAEARRE